MEDGISLNSAVHPGTPTTRLGWLWARIKLLFDRRDLNPDALEVVEIDLPFVDSVYGDGVAMENIGAGDLITVYHDERGHIRVHKKRA